VTRATIGILCLLLGVIPAPASSQVSQGRAFAPGPWEPTAPEPDSVQRSSPWFAPIASALIPGTGQLLRHEDRGALYVVAEVFLLQRFLSMWSAAHREEDRYRDLALKVARAQFGASVRDTVFEYYEQMGRYVESGPFDTDPGPRLVPPIDESTYNGNIWALARRTYFSGAAPPADTSLTYQAALAFYRSRAIGPNYLWSWKDAPIERDLFRQSIQQGDDTFRRATQQLGLLLANHFLSAVDAFVSDRLSRRRRPISLGHRLLLPGPGSPPGVQIRIRIGL
jgi:hypothetical protein